MSKLDRPSTPTPTECPGCVGMNVVNELQNRPFNKELKASANDKGQGAAFD